ncbi:hypothetical protein R1sor_026805 [Riccia sorocarpa]|uniref:Uncharacterized protein n=1 Tax=Riccia sorocarpa TaxID=122646 RepID=A0ABD3GE64_9MARC
MPPGFVGKRLPFVQLMEPGALQEFDLQHHRYLLKCFQFVPYTFKELSSIDELEFSALTRLKSINYVTRIQRLCVAEDVFWWTLFNIDADGERLLIRGLGGATCVIGWHEIQVAFGAQHDERDEFRPMKIAHKQFAALRPGEFLPETVDSNVNKKLVNGQPYEEINYYKEAAPYGPTYYLMCVIAEALWCNVRSPRFTSAMVFAYMRSLHGFSTNWAKALLHGLRTEILYLQKRAREHNDKQQVIPVVWAPAFLQILFMFQGTIFAGSSLAKPKGWVGWSHMSKDGDIDYRALLTRFPTPMDNLDRIREGCKFHDQIPVAAIVRDEPASTLVVAATPDRTGTNPRKRQRQTDGSVLLKASSITSFWISRCSVLFFGIISCVQVTNADPSPDGTSTVRTRWTPNKPSSSTAGPSNPSPVPTGSKIDNPIDVDDAMDPEAEPSTLQMELDNIVAEVGDFMDKVLAKRVGTYVAALQATASRAEENLLKLTSVNSQLQTAEQNETFMRVQVQSLRTELQKVKIDGATASKQKLDSVTTQLQTAECTIADLKNQVEVRTREIKEAKEKASTEVASNWQAKERDWQAQIVKLKQELHESKAASAETASLQQQVAELRGQLQSKDETAARFKTELEAEWHQQVAELRGQLQSKEETAARFKTELEAKWQKVAQLEVQIQQNVDLLDGFKYSAERGEKAQTALRMELYQVKNELRLLQLAK